MNLSTQPYKGARDFYPEDKRIQNYMFSRLRQVAESFGYEEYDAPILEPTELYLSKSSEEIIAEQTYSFTDRGGRNVTLRPEMTPTVSRMVAARRQQLAYPLRLYSIPDLWRYERPQAGRLRQHYQLNVDLFGIEGIEGDHEIILVADSILQSFGARRDMYTIRINSRRLVDRILSDFVQGAADQVLALMRLIDHKAKMPHDEFLAAAAKLTAGRPEELVNILSCASFDELPEPYRQHPSVTGMKSLRRLLQASGIENVTEDVSLMRGFDYYTDIVFEVFDTDPDNNRSMFGGGRYDGLVGLFGVEPVATVGFGMGDVTLQNFLKSHSLLPGLKPASAAALLVGDVYEAAQDVLSGFRLNGLNIAIDSSGRKLDSKLKHAAKSGVRFAIMIGEKELTDNRFTLRDLQTGEEQSLSPEQLVSAIKSQAG